MCFLCFYELSHLKCVPGFKRCLDGIPPPISVGFSETTHHVSEDIVCKLRPDLTHSLSMSSIVSNHLFFLCTMLWPIPMIDRFSLIQHLWDRWHMLCVYTHVQQVQRYFSCLFVHKSPRLYPAFRCFSKTKSLVPSSLIAHHWQEWPRLPQDYTEVVNVGNAEWGRMFLAPLGYDQDMTTLEGACPRKVLEAIPVPQ